MPSSSINVMVWTELKLCGYNRVNCSSYFSIIIDGARHGSIISLKLFSVYVDDPSAALSAVKLIELCDASVNHVFYAMHYAY